MLAAMCLGIDAWADTQANSAVAAKDRPVKKCTFPRSKKRAPDWVCNAQADGLALAAVGSAAKSRAGFSFMEKMAAADARKNLVVEVRKSVKMKVMGDALSANKGIDDALITGITNDSLQDTRIEKRVYSPKGTLYVLVGMDEATANKLVESVAAEYREQKRK
jgi:LPP20 lipoprotein